jgi:hypothetical protein
VDVRVGAAAPGPDHGTGDVAVGDVVVAEDGDVEDVAPAPVRVAATDPSSLRIAE